MSEELAKQNTDKLLWKRVPRDFYSPSIHATEDGRIGINVGGRVIVMSVEAWHKLGSLHADQLKSPFTDKPQ